MKPMRVVWRVLCVAWIVFAFAACGNDDGANTEVLSYESTIAGSGGESGKLSVTIDMQGASTTRRLAGAASAATVSASATLRLSNGNTITLVGTYDPATGVLSLSGGGYVLSATVAAGALNGTYTTSGGGSGYVAGLDSSAGATEVFLGTYTGTRDVEPHDLRGVFNLVIAASGRLTGLGVDDMGKGSTVDGTISGNVIAAITSSGTTISGTRSGNTVSGTFSEDQSRGTWSGTKI